MNPKTTDEKIDEIHDKVNQIWQGLYGIPGTAEDGLCSDYKTTKEDYYKFKATVIRVFSFLVGAGILTGGVLQLIKLF